MGKDYIETIPRQVKDTELASDSIDHTAIADSFIKTDSGDPAASNDTGEGYVVGSLWLNTTSGEQFIATKVDAEDATWIGQLGENINVVYHQGSSYGWTVSGNSASMQPDTYRDVIERHSFTSDGNAEDMGEFTSLRTNMATNSPDFGYGYCAGGQAPAYSDIIERFPTTASPGGADGADVGELSRTLSQMSMGTIGSAAKGIIAGGYSPPGTSDQIEVFTMASPSTSSDTGSELTTGRYSCAGGESDTQLFCMAGVRASPSVTGVLDVEIINKTTYAAADSGNELTSSAFYDGGDDATQSDVAAYKQGGQTPPGTNIDVIQKAAFASPYPVTDVGNLAIGGARYLVTGSSSTTHGYGTGGENPGSPAATASSTIEKFSYSSDGNSTDVGETAAANRAKCGGTQS